MTHVVGLTFLNIFVIFISSSRLRLLLSAAYRFLVDWLTEIDTGFRDIMIILLNVPKKYLIVNGIPINVLYY